MATHHGKEKKLHSEKGGQRGWREGWREGGRESRQRKEGRREQEGDGGDHGQEILFPWMFQWPTSSNYTLPPAFPHLIIMPPCYESIRGLIH